MIKIFFRLIIFLVLFTLAFSLLLTTISATETGSKWFINWLIKTNDIPLTIETIEGRLIDTLSLHGLHYKNEDGNEIMLGKLVIDWSPSALSSIKVHVNRIDIEDVTYRYTGGDSDEQIEVPEITLPSIWFAVSVDELNIKNTRVLIDDVEQNIQHINSSLIMNKAGLSFQLQELISEQQHLSGHVALGNNKPMVLDALINWKGELQQEVGQATFKIKGQQNNLAVALDINSVIQGKVNGSVNLKNLPYRAELNGELSGKLFEAYSEEFTLDAPIVFDLIGDLNQVSGEFNTHAKLASGDAFAFKLETNAVIPGEKYDTLNVNVNWQTFPDVTENFFLSLKGHADFEYADQILLIDHDLEFPAEVNLKGNVNFATESVELSMQWDEFAIPVSDADLFNIHSGLLNAKGKLDAIAVSLEADYLISEKNNEDKKLYNNISAEGVVNLLSKRPIVELNGTLKTSLPESIQDYIESVGIIDFVVISEEDSLKIKANSDFQSEQLGPIKLDLIAQWADSILTLDSLGVEVLDGKIKASGALNIQDKTNGTFELKGHHLNIGVINPDLFSQLDLNANVILSETAKGLSTEIDMTSLSGKWRGFPLTGSAQFAYIDDVARIEKLNLNSGNNSIDLNLNMDELLSGFVELSILDLSLFSSELGGEIKGRMKISGNIDTPNIEGKLSGKDIYVNDIRLAAISADSKIDLRPQQHSTMKLQLTSLSYQNYVFNEVLINGQGLTESHKIDITASGPELNVNTVIDAGLNNKLWSGKFMQLDVSNKDVGLWQLSSPSSYIWQVQDNVFDLNKTCLSQNEAYLCIDIAGKSSNDVSGEVEINHLPLVFVEPLLPEELLLEGEVTGNITFKLIDNNWALRAGLDGVDTKIGTAYEDEPEYLDVDVASIKLDTGKLNRELDIRLRSKDYFDLSVAGSMMNTGERPLQGKFDLVLEEIDWLQKFEPALTGSHGKFQVNITAAGTLDRPDIEGTFSLQDGLLSVLPIGLILDSINGQVQSGDVSNQIRINSIIASKTKQLSVNGHVSLLPEKAYPYEFDISGEDFPVVRTADVTMDISPEVKLYGTHDLHYIRGQLTVPLLDMLISSIPESAVTVSPDVALIQSKQPGAVQVANGNGGNDFVKNHIDLDLNVFLKPDIHIEGLGLDTRLTGDIKITKPVGLYQPRGEGQVTLIDGSYRAYGQNLEIESGRLLFAGPLDNPGISLRAYRPKLPVKPGVKISGDVRQPKLNLFSVPAQSEADTLSYIITGRPISGASGGEASLLAQAALSLGKNESSILTNQIRDMFNLDDFSVGGGDSVDSTSLSASKRLSPNLTFRSSFNPFDQLWSFLLNYKLTDNWSVQTESGVTQGADIIYSIESNSFQDMYDRFWELVKFQDQ